MPVDWLEHVRSLDPYAWEACSERFALAVVDGHVPESAAWRMAYIRTCKQYGAEPKLQGEMFKKVA